MFKRYQIKELDGDSVESHWVYDTLNQRLTRMYATSPRYSGNILDVNYSYSPQGDILTVDDHSGSGRYQTFQYDHRHRLTYSTGDWCGIDSYTAGYEYSPAGRLTRKDVRSWRYDYQHGQHSVDYDYRYLYPTTPGGNVYAADSVRDALTNDWHRLQWDADGNLTNEQYRRAGALGDFPSRRLCHNEEGLLQGYWQDDNGETVGAWYAYDAEGRRALKYASERAAGSSQSVVELCDPVYYVSPLVTLTRTGYSKHYFEGGRRICTVIGGGFAHVNWDSITSDPMPLVGPERDPLDKVLGSGAESTFDDCIEVRAELGYTDGLYKMMQNESERYVSHEPAFYYHTDHLGSTSRFTDDSGKVVQTLAYMPYGEDWVDDSKFIYSDTNHIGIYQFNGKERDFESGFYYYGARYHWPELWTGWTSPDPLMDKYPGISPYNYCNWNPVIFVDPDGMEIGDYYSTTGQYLGWDGVFDNKVHIMDDRTLLAKDGKGNIEASKVTSLVSTTYETLEATIGVFERTKKNGGSIEESTAVLAGLISRLGEKGYTGADGKPHCNFPSITEGEQGLGVTSIHSHPFTQVGVDGYHDVTPSTDDMGLFSMCNLNIIVGNITEPKTSSNVYPHSTDHVGAAFITPARTTKMDMRFIEKVVNNRHKATVEHWNQIMKGL